jgi:hypothetical protein
MDLLGPKNVFALSRDIFDHSYVGAGNGGRDPWSRLEAWAWLIARANYRPSEIDVRGDIVTLRRGQLVITHQKLAERWHWTVKQVRTFLDRLQQLGMIGRETGTPKGSHQTVLPISNYDIYQFLEGYLGHPERRPKGSPRATQGQQSNKENKENTKRAPSAEGAGHAGLEVEEAFGAYNETAGRCGLSQATVLNPKRRADIRSRLKEVGIQGWRKALANVEASAFLCGNGSQGFKADLDWLLTSGKFFRVFEGGYGNGAAQAQSDSPHVLNAEIQRIAETSMGQRQIAEKGRSAALAEFRELVLSRQNGAHHA